MAGPEEENIQTIEQGAPEESLETHQDPGPAVELAEPLEPEPTAPPDEGTAERQAEETPPSATDDGEPAPPPFPGMDQGNLMAQLCARGYSTQQAAEIIQGQYGGQGPRPDQRPPDDEFQIDFGEEADDINPAIRKSLTGMHEHYSRRDKANRQAIEQLTGALVQTQEAQAERHFDGMLRELPDEYKRFFGKGPTYRLKGNSPHRAWRQVARQQLGILLTGYGSNPLVSIPDESELIRAAADMALRSAGQSIDTNRVRTEVENRRTQAGPKPTQRATKQPVPKEEDKAEAAIAAWEKKTGKKVSE